MICEVQISVGDEASWIDHFQTWSPYVILVIGLVVAWCRSRSRAQKETRLRLAIIQKWITELKLSAIDHKTQQLELKGELLNMEKDKTTYSIPSFPNIDLKEIDFEKSFRSLVENLKFSEDEAKSHFYKYRKALRLFDRHIEVLDRTMNFYLSHIQTVKREVSQNFTKYTDYLYEVRNSQPPGSDELLNDIKDLDTQILLRKISRKTLSIRRNREDWTEFTSNLLMILQLKRDTEVRRTLFLHAREFQESHRVLSSLFQSTGNSIDNLLRQLDPIIEDLEELEKFYSKSEIKNIFQVKSFS